MARKIIKNIKEILNRLKQIEIISKMCIYLIISLMFLVPMNISFAADGEKDFLTGQHSVNEVSGTCSPAAPTNVKDSWILSVVMMCLPGVLEKTMEWQEIECDQVVCSYEAVKNNLDPTFCKKEASYKTCTFIMGEIFAMPPMAILEYFRSLIANLLANPIGMAWGMSARIARQSVDAACGVGTDGKIAGTCTSENVGFQVVFLAITDIAAMVQTFSDMMENGFNFFDDNDESSCEQLGDIRDELEGLVSNG